MSELRNGLLLATSFLVFWSASANALAEASTPNTTFTFRLHGPCGETIRGAAGSLYDDGTGGGELFENDRGGHTWEVSLARETRPEVTSNIGALLWLWSVGVEGPIEITDIALARPVEARFGFPAEVADLTGLPYGLGPQTVENHGARSLVAMGFQDIGIDEDGVYVIARIRVRGSFPDAAGESATARVFFTLREGGPFPLSYGGLATIEAMVSANRFVTREDGDPPLVLEDCEFTLLAEATTELIRCDANADGRLQISDAVSILSFLFLGGVEPVCAEALDCDGDGESRVSDAIYGLTFLFLGGEPPPEPFPDCGRVDALVDDCPQGSTSCS